MNFERYYKIIRYVISGGSAAFVTLSVLYISTDIFHIWYLFSSIIAYCFGFGVSFTLQKFWTFSHRSLDRVHRELAMYLMLGAVNLGLNALSMYVFVDFAGVPYMVAQILTSGSIAVFSFPLYKKVIFKQQAQLQ